jgi:hypothetical protein
LGSPSEPPVEGAAKLLLTWIDTSELETGFRIEISEDGESYTTHGTVAANVETYEIDGLDHNTLYYVRVIAFNGVGDSSTALEAEVYTAPPFAPTALTATATSSGSVDLEWSQPSTLPVSGYKVYHSIDELEWELVAAVTVGETEFTVESLDPSTTHYFALTAYNENDTQPDQETAQTASVSAMTFAALLSAVISPLGDELTLTFSEPMEFGAGGNGGWVLTSSGDAVTVTYASGDRKSVV